MLEIGHEFERNGVQFCVVDIVDLNNKSYCFLSEERRNEKMDFHFYEYSISSTGDVNLDLVKNDDLIDNLYSVMEERNRYE